MFVPGSLWDTFSLKSLCGGTFEGFHHPLSKFCYFYATEPPLDIRLVCTFEFVCYGPEEKKQIPLYVSIWWWSNKVWGGIFQNHQNVTISPQLNIRLTWDKSLNSSFSIVVNLAICLSLVIAVRQSLRTHFYKTLFLSIFNTIFQRSLKEPYCLPELAFGPQSLYVLIWNLLTFDKYLDPK